VETVVTIKELIEVTVWIAVVRARAAEVAVILAVTVVVEVGMSRHEHAFETSFWAKPRRKSGMLTARSSSSDSSRLAGGAE
jgi:hypothetical protein